MGKWSCIAVFGIIFLALTIFDGIKKYKNK